MMGMASWSLMSGPRQESSFCTTRQGMGLIIISMRSLDTTDLRILALAISSPERRRFFILPDPAGESNSKQETPVGRVLMGEKWLMEILRIVR